VTNLETNKGLIPIKLGQARVISSYKRIIHLIETHHYEENLRIIQNNIILVGSSINVNKEYTYAFKNKIEILEHKAQELEQNINLLKPSRIKRGVVNGLGSFIKDITGNLDQHDLEEIGNAIHNLHHDQSRLIEQNTAQIAINQGMIDRVNYIQKYINNSNKKISFELN
jgi:cob(I)alamin adenosyltransferase